MFTLWTIPNTEKFVEKELLNKFPKIKVLKTYQGKIIFDPNNHSLEDFRSLLSPLRISDPQKNKYDLFKREWRKEFVPAGINPSLAYILCQIANLNQNDIILDPFCGGSTIPITALLYFDVQKAFASDVSGRAIDVSLKNFQAASISQKRFVLFRSNISMVKLQPKLITKVITNMPFGIRSGDHDQNLKVYTSFNLKLNTLLSDNGSAVILTQEKKLIYETMEKDFKIKLIATPEQGGLRPAIFHLAKKS